jgi:hypothetical protein
MNAAEEPRNSTCNAALTMPPLSRICDTSDIRYSTLTHTRAHTRTRTRTHTHTHTHTHTTRNSEDTYPDSVLQLQPRNCHLDVKVRDWQRRRQSSCSAAVCRRAVGGHSHVTHSCVAVVATHRLHNRVGHRVVADQGAFARLCEQRHGGSLGERVQGRQLRRRRRRRLRR